MKILKLKLVFVAITLLCISCKRDKYISNRFAGVYEITKYTREHWDSASLLSTTEFPCNYVFYLNASPSDFVNPSGQLDTFGVEPSFLTPLGLKFFSGLDRFTFDWNIGTSDNYRLSLIKAKGGAALVQIDRNAFGKVKRFTYNIINPDGTYYYDQFEVKVRY